MKKMNQIYFVFCYWSLLSFDPMTFEVDMCTQNLEKLMQPKTKKIGWDHL